VQPSAGPALPHTRSRTVHWITTAAALGAVIAGVALVEPADASQNPAPAASRKPPAPVAAPDPAAVTYPLGCAPGTRTDVVSKVSADLDGDGRPETVVVVRCHADVGTPPSGVFVLAAPAAGTTPRIVTTLVRPQDDRQVSDFRLDGRTIRATVLGFSSAAAPRCCPDLSRTYTWEWRGGRYVALPGAPANSV
jgi:hypothetical protein